MEQLALALLAFIGTHWLLSHPFRKPVVARIGERGFMGLYSVVAAVTLLWVIAAWHRSDFVLLWQPSDVVLRVGQAVMLLATILFAGSLVVPNPALPMMARSLDAHPAPRGVLRITRHPMMWSFALWAAAHIAMDGTLGTLVFAGGIGLLALGGSALQDRKKAAQLGDKWNAYVAQTSFVPFGRGHVWPGALPIIAGVVLFGLLVWLHPLAVGMPTRLF